MRKRGATWNRIRRRFPQESKAIRTAQWLFLVAVAFIFLYGGYLTLADRFEVSFMSGRRLAFGKYTYSGPMFLLLGLILVPMGLFAKMFPGQRVD